MSVKCSAATLTLPASTYADSERGVIRYCHRCAPEACRLTTALRELKTPANCPNDGCSRCYHVGDGAWAKRCPLSSSMMLESLMQLVWGFLGACSGVFIGLTKEGIDLFSSLGSVQGWKQIYTGTAAVKSKKIDNNKSSTSLPSHGAIGSGIAINNSL